MPKVKTPLDYNKLLAKKIDLEYDNIFNNTGLLYLSIKGISKLSEQLKKDFEKLTVLFSHNLKTMRPDLLHLAPYKITVKPLVAKNQWSQGTYVAINKSNGTLELYLNFEKLCSMPSFPLLSLNWVIAHEFRHKVQLNNKALLSVLGYPNWANFKQWIQKKHKVTDDLCNHIFHELNPAEADANCFASELTGFHFMGNAFDITDQSLSLLKPSFNKLTKCAKKLTAAKK